MTAPIFVIQKHDATRLHYDFRLEAAGVLLSWAVPKGPSLDPAVKRLAIRVPDHPIDWAEFEGVIEEGSYGAGPVIVWDRGTYINRTTDKRRELDVMDGIERGHISFDLEGVKLKGGFSLTKTQRGEGNSWLLVKKRDSYADPSRDPVSELPGSVITGRGLEDLPTDPHSRRENHRI